MEITTTNIYWLFVVIFVMTILPLSGAISEYFSGGVSYVTNNNLSYWYKEVVYKMLDILTGKNRHDQYFGKGMFTSSATKRMEEHLKWEKEYEQKTREKLKNFKPTYKCPKCGRLGLPSIYSDQCTDCSNKQRGFY